MKNVLIAFIAIVGLSFASTAQTEETTKKKTSTNRQVRPKATEGAKPQKAAPVELGTKTIAPSTPERMNEETSKEKLKETTGTPAAAPTTSRKKPGRKK